MSKVTMKHFDVLAYVQQARKLGVSEELAEFQARKIGSISDIIQENHHKIEALKKIKSDKKGLEIRKSKIEILRNEIETIRKETDIIMMKNKLIRWMLGVGAGTILSIVWLFIK